MDADGFRGRSAIRVAAALRTARRGGGGWWVAHCPFCVERMGTPARKASLGVNEETSIWNCFRCGAKGCLKKDDAREFKKRAAEKGGGRESTENPYQPPEGFWPLAEETGATAVSLEGAREYLERRGVTPEVVRAARIGACAVGKYAGRIVIPALPEPGAQPPRGPWWGFVARTWGPKSAVLHPYLYPDNMPRGHVLYNERALDEVTETPLVVVEGAFDTFPVWPDGCALFGETSEAQVIALTYAKRPVAVVLDGDAWRKGVGLARRLAFDGARAGAVILPPTLDPDQVPVRELREACWECIERGEVRL